MGPERKFYQEIKKSIPNISWIRLENLSLSGTPDLLGYNANHHFFTVELKVTKSNKVRFSPHQIAFHVKHPDNSFILVKLLGQRSVKLFQGSRIKELVACGLSLETLRSASRFSLASCSFRSLAISFQYLGLRYIKLPSGHAYRTSCLQFERRFEALVHLQPGRRFCYQLHPHACVY